MMNPKNFEAIYLVIFLIVAGFLCIAIPTLNRGHEKTNTEAANAAIKEHIERIEEECNVGIYERDGKYILYDLDEPNCCPQPPYNKDTTRNWKEQISIGRWTELQEILARIERECKIDLYERDGKLSYTPVDPKGCSPISDGSL